MTSLICGGAAAICGLEFKEAQLASLFLGGQGADPPPPAPVSQCGRLLADVFSSTNVSLSKNFTLAAVQNEAVELYVRKYILDFALPVYVISKNRSNPS